MPIASEIPINTDASALEMANTMFGGGVSVVSADYTGATTASGTYSDADATANHIAPSDSGVILSTGNATNITNASGDVNVSAGTTTNHGTAGDADLNAVSGQTTFDAAIFEAEFVPVGDTLTMQLVFSSEEYLEYVDSGFNDAVGIWVNGVQAQLSVGTGEISIDSINSTENQNLYVDNAATDDNYNTEMDGFTVTLTLKAPVTPNAVNTIKIGIADGGDGAYDSNLLIAADSLQTSLIAHDDDVSMHVGQESNIDLLGNDESDQGSILTITHISGQPVSMGDTVTLASGETIQLGEDGFVLTSATDVTGESVFSYTVADDAGNTDVAFVTLTTTPCFTSGTVISTPDGGKMVEALAVGDLVETLDHGPKPLLWIGRSQRYASAQDAPIVFDAGVLGATTQTAVSPQHRVLITGADPALFFGLDAVFVKAHHLINENTIRRRMTTQIVTYYHLLFDKHEVICGDGIFSESFQPGRQTENSFDPNLQNALGEIVNQHGLSGMQAARPTLKKHEAKLIAPEVDLPFCVALQNPDALQRSGSQP